MTKKTSVTSRKYMLVSCVVYSSDQFKYPQAGTLIAAVQKGVDGFQTQWSLNAQGKHDHFTRHTSQISISFKRRIGFLCFPRIDVATPDVTWGARESVARIVEKGSVR